MTTDRMTVKDQQRLARDVNLLLARAECQCPPTQRHLGNAYEAAKKNERKHRNMVRPFTRGQCGYRLSVVDTAWIFVGRAFVKQLLSDDWLVGPGLRLDVSESFFAALAFKADRKHAEQCGANASRFEIMPADELAELSNRLEAWDYARHCAK